ncbi:hypothetical protein GH733_014481 [Mirounga leonina]|nr:hypothetical protein GH733_014481 [Mirounga leonina]
MRHCSFKKRTPGKKQLLKLSSPRYSAEARPVWSGVKAKTEGISVAGDPDGTGLGNPEKTSYSLEEQLVKPTPLFQTDCPLETNTLPLWIGQYPYVVVEEFADLGVVQSPYEVYYATAYWMPAEKTVQVKKVLDRNGDAYGFYNDSMKTTGWGILEIRAGYGSQTLSNEIIMFVAGFLEGYLTAPKESCEMECGIWAPSDKSSRRETEQRAYWKDSQDCNSQTAGTAKDLLQLATQPYSPPTLLTELWYTYAAMLRIYKHWDFNIKDKDTSSSRLSFSSYPGFLESLDDFYILSSGLVLLQTTNSVYNKTLLKLVVPQSLLAWQRVRVANMMANDGRQWAEIFSNYNSGTYNNQYMVLDLKKVKPKYSLDAGTLYIVEQIPTYVEYSDQTEVLRRGYWPSYNIPFHEKIYSWSGYPMLVQKLGLEYSYDMASRAKIFRRDQGDVTDMASMKYIMRYNNYRKDPYSKGDPCNTICCREDLNSLSPSPGGCYDTKVADIYLASAYTAYAISGPTVQGGLPVFHWNRFNKTLHKGMPETYDFDFITMKPVLKQN